MKSFLNIGCFLFLFFITLFWSCKGPSSSTIEKKQNYNYLYNPSSSSFHPSAQVFHSNDSISEIVIKLFPDELLFNKANAEGIMRAYVTINLILHRIEEDGSLAAKARDSLSFDYTVDKDEVNRRYYISALFKAYRGENYYLICNIKDNNRNSHARKYIYVNKNDIFNYQNFRALYNGTDQLLFDPKITNGEMLKIMHSDTTVKKLFVKYYKAGQKPAMPVFMAVTEPDIYRGFDSIFTVEFDKYLLFRAPKEGIYLFQIDTSIAKGLSLFRYYDNFPKVEESLQLARPLAYLASDVKYKEMIHNKNIKLVVDEFWLNLASDNTERARQLIRIYYNRVFFANYYFTSHKEGWMTDRGLVFVIYGQPDMINKDHKSENWIYLGDRMKRLIDFKFVKEENAFGDNHFVLIRSEVSTFWREAMVSWQSGMVFSVDNIRN